MTAGETAKTKWVVASGNAGILEEDALKNHSRNPLSTMEGQNENFKINNSIGNPAGLPINFCMGWP